MRKVIPVNIVMSYPVKWGKYQVIRDFVQNFYDSVGYNDWHQKFSYTYENEKLLMWVDGITFSYEWLLHIGASTKTANSKAYAGYFGEGFKIASLCAKRDFEWGVNMNSANWRIEVEFVERQIEDQSVKMMAYRLHSTDYEEKSLLTLSNFSSNDYRMFLNILESFYFPENKMFGKKIWSDINGAVYFRSKTEIAPELPVVPEYGRKGVVFAGYQMLGTNPFGLAVCLHRYEKTDRERRALYAFDIVDIFTKISYHIDARGAMEMLIAMRRYWNSVLNRKRWIKSWSRVIDNLVYQIGKSEEVTNEFRKKYPNLLHLKRIDTTSERNRRRQARSWLSHQCGKYTLVRESFSVLGYPTLEEECQKHGGLVEKEEILNTLENQCFEVLEEVCRELFLHFFAIDNIMPKRRIIINDNAIYHGMAIVYRRKKSVMNYEGIAIKYDIQNIYLKKKLFSQDKYFDSLATYIHEMCHMFGGDSSQAFSLGLTKAMEILMLNQQVVEKGRVRWQELFIRKAAS